MKKLNSQLLQELDSFLNSNNITSSQTIFIEEKILEEEKPLDVNYEKGILVYYNSFTNNEIEITFDSYITEKFQKLFSSIIIDLENQNIQLPSLSFNKYKKRVMEILNKSYNTIRKRFKYLPSFLTTIQQCIDYLNSNFTPINKNESNSDIVCFDAKTKHNSPQSLKSIFEFIVKNEYLEVDYIEKYDYSDFLDVFAMPNTTVKFNCETGAIAYILKKIQPFYYNLSFKNIEKSQKFLSKQGTILTEKNLNKSLSIFRNKKNQKFDILESFFIADVTKKGKK